MATNLRLDEREAEALRVAAERAGRSQQALIREALDRYLGLGPMTTAERAVADGLVRPPSEFIDVEPHIRLSAGSTLDLLDRDER